MALAVMRRPPVLPGGGPGGEVVTGQGPPTGLVARPWGWGSEVLGRGAEGEHCFPLFQLPGQTEPGRRGVALGGLP